MADPRTLYEILGVNSSADAVHLKSAWRATMRRVHPDVGGTAAQTLEAQAAYETLSDPKQRRRYDERWVSQLRRESAGAMRRHPLPMPSRTR